MIFSATLILREINFFTIFQGSAMKLVHNERNGEAFDSQLVIGVRESYVNLCSNPMDRLQIYRYINDFQIT